MREPLSAQILRRAAKPWERALSMPFITEVIADSISDEVFERYLVWEGLFVDAAARSVGAAVLRAPDQHALIGHSRSLAMLVNDQFGCFDTSPQLPGPKSAALAEPLIEDCLADAARLSYPELVATMLASELLYRVWCHEAAITPSRRSAIAEWVDSHNRAPFTTQVDFLVAETDRLAVEEHEVSRLASIFAGRLEREIDFHAAAFVAD
jgi:thiaminase/transcriptional activator TenA